MLLARRGDGSYRLHDLFREFIRDRLKRNPTLHANVVSTLASALERTSSIDDAIAIQVEGSRWDQVLDLLTRFGLDRIMNGNRAGIAAAMRRLPANYQRHHVVAGLRGYMFYLDGREAAENELRFALSGDLDRTFRGAIQLALALYLQSTSRPREATELLRILMADEVLPKDLRVNAAGTLAATYAMSMETTLAREAMQFCAGTLELAPAELRALLHHRLSFCYFMFGDRAAAESHALRSVELAQAIGDDRMLSRAYSILCSGACSWDTDAVQALHYARAMNRASLAAGDRVMLVHGYYVELGIAAETGDDELFVEVDRRIRALGASVPHRNIMLIAHGRVIHLVNAGDRTGALRVLRGLNTNALKPAERCLWDALLALLLVDDEKEESKKHLRRPVLAANEDFDSLRIAAFGAAYAALAHWLLGREGVRKLRLPSTTLIPRDATVIDVMLAIAATSRRSLTLGQLVELTEPLIRNDFAGHARFLRSLLVPVEVASASLTASELDVLRELRRGGTTGEIARRTGRSSNTVLVHVRSACSKIGCSGRAAAVAYAVGRGWIE
jgi:DNA-binding CsgD family transcriptional regulator/tetratricopeptide (TPR) repeat protein